MDGRYLLSRTLRFRLRSYLLMAPEGPRQLKDSFMLRGPQRSEAGAGGNRSSTFVGADHVDGGNRVEEPDQMSMIRRHVEIREVAPDAPLIFIDGWRSVVPLARVAPAPTTGSASGAGYACAAGTVTIGSSARGNS